MRECRVDRIGGLAADVAFLAVLSVFPALVVLAATAGSIPAPLGSAAQTDPSRLEWRRRHVRT